MIAELPMKRILIMGCTKDKFVNPGKLPAIERYNGESFQIVRRFIRQCKSAPDPSVSAPYIPIIVILSAKYGWLLQDDAIIDYNQTWGEEEVDLAYPVLYRQWASRIMPLFKDCTSCHVHLVGPYVYALQRISFYHTVANTIAQVTTTYPLNKNLILSNWLNYDDKFEEGS